MRIWTDPDEIFCVGAHHQYLGRIRRWASSDHILLSHCKNTHFSKIFALLPSSALWDNFCFLKCFYEAHHLVANCFSDFKYVIYFCFKMLYLVRNRSYTWQKVCIILPGIPNFLPKKAFYSKTNYMFQIGIEFRIVWYVLQSN